MRQSPSLTPQATSEPGTETLGFGSPARSPLQGPPGSRGQHGRDVSPLPATNTGSGAQLVTDTWTGLSSPGDWQAARKAQGRGLRWDPLGTDGEGIMPSPRWRKPGEGNAGKLREVQ